jgi:hypothetical protein
MVTSISPVRPLPSVTLIVLVPVVSVPGVCGTSTEVEKLPPLSILIVEPSLYLADKIVSPPKVIVETVELAVNPLPVRVTLWLGTMESAGVAVKLAEPMVIFAFRVVPAFTYSFWIPEGTLGTVSVTSPTP